jgi:hypothetical protein
MANLTDLKKFSEFLMPALEGIFAKAGNGDDGPSRDVDKAFERLGKFVSEAGDPTPASLAQRSEAIVATRAVLNEIIVQAASNNTPLPETTVTTIQAQRNALRNQFALLLEKSVFEDIPRLLSDNDIARFSDQLERAQEDVASRQKVKQTLDAVISAALIASKIAGKRA